MVRSIAQQQIAGSAFGLTELDFLKPIHEDAHLKNLRKIKKLGTEIIY